MLKHSYLKWYGTHIFQLYVFGLGPSEFTQQLLEVGYILRLSGAKALLDAQVEAQFGESKKWSSAPGSGPVGVSSFFKEKVWLPGWGKGKSSSNMPSQGGFFCFSD